MKKLNASCRLLLISLWHKYNYFSKRNKLGGDGSFYYDDKRLAEETGMDKKTIMRVKRYLKERGYIAIKNGASKGRATEYWVLRKPGKKSTFVDISKPDNLPVKPDNLSVKAPQNGTPNKVITNIINNTVNLNIKEEELKNGIESLARLKGFAYAKDSFLRMGFPEEEIKKILDART